MRQETTGGLIAPSPAPQIPVDPANDPAAGVAPALGRSGLDLLDLLATTDLIARREPTGVVETDVGLEQARGLLLRNSPGEALTALDRIWDAASGTEEGWYLRAGALLVLGLPAECERVAQQGIGFQPTSSALGFVQSLARFALGDLIGARAALHPALQRAPNDQLMQVQHALIQAKLGDPRAAQTLLTWQAQHPEHPALAWGRATLRVIVADAARLHSLRGEWLAFDTPVAAEPSHAEDASVLRPHAASPGRGSTDVATTSFEHFGEQLVTVTLDEVAREARLLIRALSTGGTLTAAMSAEQGHAARTLLTTILSVIHGEKAESPTSLRAVVAALITMLRADRVDEAERMVRRHSATMREPAGRFLSAVVRGAIRSTRCCEDAPLAELTGASASALTSTHETVPTVRGDSEWAPVIAVRLGLGLVEEAPHVRAGEGWGAAAAARPEPVGEADAGTGVPAAALCCLALAAVAIATAHGVTAVGLAVGATWLWYRRRAYDADPSLAPEPAPPQ